MTVEDSLYQEKRSFKSHRSDLGYVHITLAGSFPADTKTISFCMNSNGLELVRVFHTHWTSCRGGWPGRVGELNPSPHSWVFPPVLFGSSLCSYLFPSGTVWIGVHMTPNYGTEPIWYVILHFWDLCSAASLDHRNHAEITILMCEQKPYPVQFSCRRKSYLLWCEYSLSTALDKMQDKMMKSSSENSNKNPCSITHLPLLPSVTKFTLGCCLPPSM